LSQNNERVPVGNIVGKVGLGSFTVAFIRNVTRKDFLTVFYKDQPFVFIIHNLWREDNVLYAFVKIIGNIPDAPVNSESDVFISTKEEIQNALKLESNISNTLELGTISGTEIPAKFNVGRLGRLFITGRSGSGKSYTVGVIIEELIKKQIAIVIFDRHGEYSTLKLLREDLDFEQIKIERINLGDHFFDVKDLSSVFARHIIEFGDPNINPSVDLELKYLFATQPKDIVSSSQCTIINLSGLSIPKQQYIVNWVIKKLFEARIKREIPGFFIFIDEAHELAGKKQSEVMETVKHIAQEGRKFDINLAVITQRPQLLDVTLRAQAGTWIIHKLTDINDVNITLSSAEGLSKKQDEELIQNLAVGEAIIVGELSPLAPVIVKIRERYTIHGGAGHNILDYVKEEDQIHKNKLIYDLQSKISEEQLKSIENIEIFNTKDEYDETKLNENIKKLEDENMTLKQKVEELESKNKQLLDNIKNLNDEINNLQNQNKELNQKYMSEKQRANKAIKVAEDSLKELKKLKRI